jgi:hypothetical protein
MPKLQIISLAAVLAVSASAQTEERIPWQHSSLEMYLAGVTDEGDRARIELCVRPKEGVQAGTTSVGYPQCRTEWGRWMDCVIGGIDRSRSLHASTATGPACFLVLAPPDATEIALPVGHGTLKIQIPEARQARAAPEPKLEPELKPETEVKPETIAPADDPWSEPAPAAEPKLVLAEVRDAEGPSLPVPRDHIVSVHLRIENKGEGAAEGLVAWIEPGAGVFAAKDGASRIELGDLAPGGTADFVYRCYADRSATALSFQVTLDQGGSAAATTGSVVSFPLAEVTPPPRPVSDVDGEVAASLSARPSALAVVIGVEAYAKIPSATFASADAKTAARYFERVLGIPAARIELRLDGEATLAQMQRVFGADGWLTRRVSPDSEIFVFFAGHGMAEPEKFSPYLLPADSDPDYLRQTAFSLDKMVEMIASLGARRTTLFVDACFSGLSREGVALLEDARPLLIEQAQRVPAGLSIFSAGSGSQIVSSLAEQGHGVFSYYLFKGLAGEADLDHDRRVLASELKSYLGDAVPRAAQSLEREQTPGIVLADPEQVLVQLP